MTGQEAMFLACLGLVLIGLFSGLAEMGRRGGRR